MNLIRWIKAAFGVASAAMIAGGVCLMLRPDVSASAICMALGILSVVYGIIRLAGYFCNDLYRLAFQFDMAVGILSILIGGVLLFRSDRVLTYLPIVTGIFLLVDSVLRLQTAIDAKHFGMGKWWLILVLAIGGAALGTALLLRPYDSGRVLVRLVGLTLLIDGCENLLACLYTVKVPRRSCAKIIEGQCVIEENDL
ncbi:MAG: hypothetical protein HFF05_02745 [Oscillospiraceae bacterium]|nr:hypothetical protein [Oscillospiraceae bacterium]